MSGHSKWSTIKRQKAANDQARGRLFSKLSRAISIAVKSGGNDDPEMNHKLRMAIDQAKASNMPKSNIERAIKRAGETGNIEEVSYEGYGPENIAVVVEAATDNRNRTVQEIKNIFERVGGSLGGPGSVSYMFETKGHLAVKKVNAEEQILNLIDLGVEDVEESEDAIEVYTPPADTHEIKKAIEELGYEVISAEVIQKPKTYQNLTEDTKIKKVFDFLDRLEDHDDVQKVFANVDIPDDMVDLPN